MTNITRKLILPVILWFVAVLGIPAAVMYGRVDFGIVLTLLASLLLIILTLRQTVP